MSRKYIRELIVQDFVYPNNQISEYDIEVVHDINEYSVSGNVTNFSATTLSSTGITVSFNYYWQQNNAEKWIDNANNLHLLSLHVLPVGQTYYKPWRCIGQVVTGTTTNATYSGTATISYTPANVGKATFTSGTYYYEVRIIGHKSVLPICITITHTIP